MQPLLHDFRVFRSRPWLLCLSVLILLTGIGCSLTRESTDTLRSPLEQLLLSQSLERSLAESQIAFTPGTTIVVEPNGYSSDIYVAKTAVENWLSREGYAVKLDPALADYTLRLTVQSLGTETDMTFVGLPPFTGTFVPVSLPELSIYKSIQQVGYTRLVIDMFKTKGHQYLTTLPMLEGQVFYTNYTFLFVLSWKDTDLNPPPPT